VVSSAADWSRFLSALVSGKLFPAAQVKEMETTVSEGSQTPERYGLGLQSLPTPCGTVWGNEGQVPGYNSVDYTNATGTRTVVLLATTTFGLLEPKTAAANETLINAAVCAMLDKPITAATAAASK
jgi:D-alanyl-D-alanine carboxypeptidase